MAKGLTDLDRFITKFRRILAKNAPRVENVALVSVEGVYKNRIFNKGLDSNGRKIGDYSTKDILIGAKSFRDPTQASKFLGVKKNRQDLDWVTVRNRRLAVLEGGYKNLRRLQGLRTDRVNLQYRDDLFRSIQKGRTPSGERVIGFTGAEDDLQRVKATANEKRFNTDIFSLSKTEFKVIDKAVIREVDAILRKL